MPQVEPPRRQFLPAWLRQPLVGGGLLVFGAVVVFVVWRCQLSHKVNIQLAAIRAAGLPTTGTELNTYYAAVPDRQNAALALGEACKQLRNYPDERSNAITMLELPMGAKPLTPKQRVLLAGYVQMNSAALTTARHGLALARCRYPVDFSLGLGTRYGHVARLKRLALLFCYEGAVASDANDTKDAFLSTEALFELAKSLDEEPSLISQGARKAILGVAKNCLERSLADVNFDASQMEHLQQLITRLEAGNVLARALIGERAMAIPIFRMSRAELDRLESSDEALPSSAPLPGPQPLLAKLTGFLEQDLHFYLACMSTNISLVQRGVSAYPVVADNFGKASAEADRHHYVGSSMLLEGYSQATIRQVQVIADLRLMRTALAIASFRQANEHIPRTLKEISPKYLITVPSDPFDGEPLRYRRLDSGYVIYSVDEDRHDDGGRERPEQWNPSDRNTYDLTFPVER